MQTRTIARKQTSKHLMLPVYPLGCSASDASREREADGCARREYARSTSVL